MVKHRESERKADTEKREQVTIAAAAAYRNGKYREAEELLATARERSEATVACDLLQALVHCELREYQECVEVGGRVIVQLEHDSALQSSLPDAPAFITSLHNAIGLAYYSLEQCDSAQASFKRATEHDADDHEGYLNLARACARIGDQAGERRAISDGLVHCREKNELQMLARPFLGEETISLCMIVKNEEEFLPQSLESVKDLVSEIIVVDTGSEDDTVKIAESFGAKVYRHPWENNFSLHRNQSLDYAGGDWILIIDADEELSRADHDKLRMATRIPDINIVSITVQNQNRQTGEFTSFLASTRLWRRKLGAHYEGIVHNELRLPPDEPILRADVRLTHYGYGLDREKMKQKMKRTRDLLEQQLAENPDNPFTNFNYAQLLRGEEKTPTPETCRLIVEHSGRTVSQTDPGSAAQRHLHVSALDQMSAAYFYLQEFDRAAEISLQALKVDPKYVDPMFNLGHIYAAKRDFPKAIESYRKYLDFVNNYDIGNELNNYILLHVNEQAEAHYGLGLVYEQTGEFDQAIENFLSVLGYRQDHLDTRTRLAGLYLKQGDLQAARKFATDQIESDDADVAARLILAEVLGRENQLAEAAVQYRAILDVEAGQETALRQLIEIERQQGRQAKALQWTEKLLEAHPDHYRGLTLKAELLLALGKPEAAIEVYQHMLSINRRDPDTHNNLGNCHFKRGELQQAVQSYAEALSIKPQMEIALRNIGLSYLNLKDYDQALEKLTRYLDYASNDIEILYLVARLQFESSRFSEAIRHLERGLVLKPDSAELVSFLADCYLKLGHYDSARLGYEQAVKLDPGFKPAIVMLAEVKKLLAQQLEAGRQ